MVNGNVTTIFLSSLTSLTLSSIKCCSAASWMLIAVVLTDVLHLTHFAQTRHLYQLNGSQSSTSINSHLCNRDRYFMNGDIFIIILQLVEMIM